MLAKLAKFVQLIRYWIKIYKKDIILFITVVLISLLSFAAGHIVKISNF